MNDSGSLLLIDGPNLAMRAIKAAEGRLVLSASGVWTAPVYITIRAISKYVRRYHPSHIAVCFDRGHTFQDSVYSDYKGNRNQAPDEEWEERKRDTFFLLREFLSLAGIFAPSAEGFEADDLIAHYCGMAQGKVVIVSGDKDLLQLVNPDVLQVRPGHNTSAEDEEWDEKRVIDEMGVQRAEHLRLVMALTGDSSDGIPGIPGFGIKTAAKHLAEKDWDLRLLLDEPPPRLAKTEGYREIVHRNLALVDLDHPLRPDVPLASTPPVFIPSTPGSAQWNDLLHWLDTYEMTTIKRELLAGDLWKGEA